MRWLWLKISYSDDVEVGNYVSNMIHLALHG